MFELPDVSISKLLFLQIKILIQCTGYTSVSGELG